MRTKGIFVTIVVVLALIFTAFNWAALSTNLPINFLFFTAQLPLGLFLVGTVVALSLLFLLLSLFRRAGQLRQITHLENQNDHLRTQLDKQRSGEVAALEKTLLGRFDTLESHLSETNSGIRTAVGEHTSQIEAHERAQVERLEERVLMMRNELAADIAQVETSLKKSLPSSTSSSSSTASTAASPTPKTGVEVVDIDKDGKDSTKHAS